MIPVRYIQEWKQYAPWANEARVKQDLVIGRTSRNVPNLCKENAFEEEQLFTSSTFSLK